MKHKTNRHSGFTLVEIMIVVAIIGLLAAIAIPNFVRARTQSQMNACINNLRQIDGAVQQWALENKKNSSDTVQFSDISGYLKSAVICPAGGTAFSDSYSMPGSVTNKPSCKKQTATHILPLDTTS
jgi:prepilin-type N-terminal cleavage/methylation domain-containing protein